MEPGKNEAESAVAITADTVTAISADDTATASGNADTAAAPGAPMIVDADSTIQVVENLTLHAVGNTPEAMHFNQDTLEAKAGSLVKLKLTNEAQDMSMVHNVVFTAPGKYKEVALAGAEIGPSGNYAPKSENVIAASPIALPGQTIELEFKAPIKPGVYEFVCTYPGHWQRMHGKFIVK